MLRWARSFPFECSCGQVSLSLVALMYDNWAVWEAADHQCYLTVIWIGCCTVLSPSFPTYIIASEHGSDQYITYLHGEIIFPERHLSFSTLLMTFDKFISEEEFCIFPLHMFTSND